MVLLPEAVIQKDRSDVDIALVMHGKLDSDTEDRLSDFVVDMNLKYDKFFFCR